MKDVTTPRQLGMIPGRNASCTIFCSCLDMPWPYPTSHSPSSPLFQIMYFITAKTDLEGRRCSSLARLEKCNDHVYDQPRRSWFWVTCRTPHPGVLPHNLRRELNSWWINLECLICRSHIALKYSWQGCKSQMVVRYVTGDQFLGILYVCFWSETHAE